MIRSKLAPIAVSFIALPVLALACNQPFAGLGDGSDSMTQTQAAHETDQAAGATETPPPASTGSPTAEPTSTATLEPTATIQHFQTPGAPSGVERFLTDASSQAYASEGRAIGDDFSLNRLERPFTSGEMAYQAHLDIVRAELDEISPWIYVTIFLEGTPPQGSPALYGVELDLDGDGGGDWLVMAQAPASTSWSVAGVRAYQDANDDVGGSEPMQAEPPSGLGDGYEQLAFDAGIGNDPDAAWVRIPPSGPNRVQIAFKSGLVGTSEFLWGVWADAGPQDPGAFDYNDSFTPQQAGSPLLNNPNYPLDQLAAVDNSCRDAFGFETTGREPGLCVIPGSISGVVWKDRCLITGGEGGEPMVLGRGCQGSPPNWTSDGIYEPSWEPGIQGVVVDLGSGACPSTGLATSTTDSAGRYSFRNLSAGRYCVSIGLFDHDNGSDLIPGGWRVPESGSPVAQYTINLLAGENRSGVNFGWLSQFGD